MQKLGNLVQVCFKKNEKVWTKLGKIIQAGFVIFRVESLIVFEP